MVMEGERVVGEEDSGARLVRVWILKIAYHIGYEVVDCVHPGD